MKLFRRRNQASRDGQGAQGAHEGFYHIRPPSKNVWEHFKEFIWNPEKRTFCSRTPKNWLTITIYYIIFLFCSFAILYGALQVVKFIAVTRDVDKPRYTLDESPIGSDPNVNYVPIEITDAPYLRLDEDVDKHIDKIDDLLDNYKNCKGPKCVNLSIGDCGKSPYGYNDRKPCVFIKLSRLLGWEPQPYTSQDELPENMPNETKKLIKSSNKNGTIWVHCEGTTPLDRDHIPVKNITFQNTPGFDASYFPFTKQKKYYDPIVAVKFDLTEFRGLLHSRGIAIYRVLQMSALFSGRKKPRLLSDTEKRLIREAFDLFDSNNDGYLDYYELKASTRSLGFKLKKKEIVAILETYDRDNLYLINYEDFYEIMEEKMQKRDPLEEVKEAFKLIANDKTNCISFRDLKYAADRVGADIPERDLRSMIEEFDTKGEGKIDEEDFINIITGDAA